MIWTIPFDYLFDVSLNDTCLHFRPLQMSCVFKFLAMKSDRISCLARVESEDFLLTARLCWRSVLHWRAVRNSAVGKAFGQGTTGSLYSHSESSGPRIATEIDSHWHGGCVRFGYKWQPTCVWVPWIWCHRVRGHCHWDRSSPGVRSQSGYRGECRNHVCNHKWERTRKIQHRF